MRTTHSVILDGTLHVDNFSKTGRFCLQLFCLCVWRLDLICIRTCDDAFVSGNSHSNKCSQKERIHTTLTCHLIYCVWYIHAPSMSAEIQPTVHRCRLFCSLAVLECRLSIVVDVNMTKLCAFVFCYTNIRIIVIAARLSNIIATRMLRRHSICFTFAHNSN